MAAEAIFEEVKGKVRRLNRREKIKLFSKIISESHPAFKVGKRGKVRSFAEAKHKLKRDIRRALIEEQKRESSTAFSSQIKKI